MRNKYIRWDKVVTTKFILSVLFYFYVKWAIAVSLLHKHHFSLATF